MKYIAHLKSKQGMADLGGILFLLLAGYFFLSGSWQQLYRIITPREPVLLMMDWKGSVMESLHQDPTHTSYKVQLSRVYNEDEYGYAANIRQVVIWYANTQDAKSAWQNPQKEISRQIVTGDRYPFFPLNMGRNATSSLLDQFDTIPIPPDISISSSISCYNYPYYEIKRRTCIYFGYYEHWYTQIWFGENTNRLNDKAMFDLIEKAIQIIKAAPPPAR